MRQTRHSNLIGLSLAVIAAGLIGYQTLATRLASGPQQPPVVAVVNIELVVNSINQYADAKRQIEQIGRQQDGQIEAVEAQIKQKLADADAFPPGSERALQANKELLALSGEFSALRAYKGRLLDREWARALLDIFKLIMGAAQEIAVANGYELVLADDSMALLDGASATLDVMQQMSMRRVLYAHPTLDITNDVIVHLNR